MNNIEASAPPDLLSLSDQFGEVQARIEELSAVIGAALPEEGPPLENLSEPLQRQYFWALSRQIGDIREKLTEGIASLEAIRLAV